MLWGPGRRRGFRRAGEGRGRYVDRPAPDVLGAVLFIAVASALDAHLTLEQLQAGAFEANPLMDLVIRRSSRLFVAGKMLLTGAGAVLLAVHQMFPLGRSGLRLLAIAYGLLLAYHGLLLSLAP